METVLNRRLVELFRWIDPGPGSTHLVSDISGWWRDPEVLAQVGPALAGLHPAARPTVVIAPEVTGLLLGPLVAVAAGAGFLPAYKDGGERRRAGPTRWADTPPDYRGRRLRVGVDGRRLGPGDRVLLVDDWVDTGAQLDALCRVVRDAGADLIGAAALVATCPPEVRERLRLRALLTGDQLP
ncbi:MULTISPECIES: phosphoribosyltransferase family protein [unclassified Micromonospora]|uniref:phosphoribosyltransferase family protein n=1 Tax=unclassified Micromonospora TaxID=2617518 RepID=UPI001B3717FA|nr:MULTISPECIES: phosphoribosyltransferase family protein [unclassified Micromonospora]MBQ1044047.1 phosphoribosyltransferase [Micromonospora sp. C72]MBQ1054659.1 phosphoribosyltransferase [Micromonospora sp. C32]